MRDKFRETARWQRYIKRRGAALHGMMFVTGKRRLDYCYSSTKVVGNMRQNARFLAFCVQNLLSFAPQWLVCREELAWV